MTALIAGCSDNITSNPDLYSAVQIGEDPVSSNIRSIELYYSLKPKQHFTIWAKYTKLSTFNSIIIENHDPDNLDPGDYNFCKDLVITATKNFYGETFIHTCFAEVDSFDNFTVQNISDKTMNLKAIVK